VANAGQLSKERVAKVRNFKARSHEGVADLLDTIPNRRTILIDHHVDNFLLTALHKVLREVG